jgi:hypothetical protein
MKKSIVVALLCFSMTFFNSPSVMAAMITLQDLNQQNKLATQALREIDRPEVQAQLAAFGISPEEAKTRLAALSDQEIKDLLGSHTGQKAGGDIVIGLTTVLLIIIIILLLR